MRALVASGLSVLLAVGLVPSPVDAYPISPVPLWDLVERSDLVVLAEVVEIRSERNDAARRDTRSLNEIIALLSRDSRALLRVRETWKGAAVSSVVVPFELFLICPAPPRYVPGRTVIAFLRSKDGRWATTGLSYGTLYPRTSDVEDFRSLVRQAVALQNRSPVSAADKMDWHVRAASMPGPRWHGLYALVPESDHLHYTYDQRKEGRRLGGGPTREHLREIAAGFTRYPSTDRTLPMVLAVLRGFRDRDVDRAAASAMEALLSRDESPWWIENALYLTLERFGDTDPRGRLAPHEKTYGEVSFEQVRSLWAEAKAELGIPDMPAAGILEAEVRGVGPDTPN